MKYYKVMPKTYPHGERYPLTHDDIIVCGSQYAFYPVMGCEREDTPDIWRAVHCTASLELLLVLEREVMKVLG